MNRFNNLITRMNGKSYLKEKHNPGVTIVKDFLNKDDETSLLKETIILFEKYSFQSCESIHLETKDNNNSKNSKTIVNAHRVTGRPEVSQQKHAPWLYGNSFNKNALDEYPEMLNLVRKVELIVSKEDDNKIPELRDITINYRTKSMFVLDPHIDPLDDGGHVFILGLKSDTVMTLTPDIDLLMKKPKIFKNHIEAPMKMRTEMNAITALSWTDMDIDILIPKRGLLHLKNDARFSFKHAIRAGVEVDTSALSDDYKHLKNTKSTVICDWFGNINNLVPREQERISVILAFK